MPLLRIDDELVGTVIQRLPQVCRLARDVNAFRHSHGRSNIAPEHRSGQAVLAVIGQASYLLVLIHAQDRHHLAERFLRRDVIGMKSVPTPYISAILGNRLRASTSEIKQRLSERSEEALEALRAKMLALVRANDATIMSKRLSENRRDALIKHITDK